MRGYVIERRVGDKSGFLTHTGFDRNDELEYDWYDMLGPLTKVFEEKTEAIEEMEDHDEMFGKTGWLTAGREVTYRVLPVDYTFDIKIVEEA